MKLMIRLPEDDDEKEQMDVTNELKPLDFHASRYLHCIGPLEKEIARIKAVYRSG
jgi:hypothetical protein